MKIKRKSGTGLSAIIAAVCIVIYLAALIQGAVRFYFSIEKCRITAEQEFSRVAALALSAGMQSFLDERFNETMNAAVRSSNTIEGLIITGPDGDYAFERQKGQAITWVNESPRFINRLSFSNVSYYKPLPIQDVRNANIKAVVSAFDFNEITNILKETLLIILIGFAVAFFTMLLQLLLGKPESEPQIAKAASDSRKKTDTSHEKIDPVYESVSNEQEAEPKGLYSPRSSIGWEEYTKDRLNSELHRCSSTEKDLTLIIMEFTDITNDSMFKQAAEEAVSFFLSRDLLFEYDEKGISVILPGVDLDAGISRAEKFQQRIMEKFPDHHAKSSLNIGLTSRSGRLLNADRMMFEGSQALKRAKSDRDSSIIGFKSDPEKYRTFIASQK